MNIDALTVLLEIQRGKNLGGVTAQLYRALDEVESTVAPWPHQCEDSTGKRCPRCVPQQVSSALAAALTREREQRILDWLWPPLRYQTWQPVAKWLCDVGKALSMVQRTQDTSVAGMLQTLRASRTLSDGKTTWHEAVAKLPDAAVARSKGGVAFVFALIPGVEGMDILALLFDWRTFNRCASGPEEVTRVLATVSDRVRSVAGAGGPSVVWKDGLRQCLTEPERCGALIVASRGVARGFEDHVSKVGRYVAGWRPQREEKHQVTDDDTSPLGEPSIFAPTWSGCSGRFVLRKDGRDEALLHYDKHVRHQREWAPAELSDVTAYVTSAVHALDECKDSVELWQPSNHAVVKYDPSRDAVVIGNLFDGDLQTYFRPGGSDYVLRKLRSGHWVPPPLMGSIQLETSQDDEELSGLFAEFERAVAEADAEALAAAAHDPRRILSAIATQERAEYVAWQLRSQYLTASDEARLDAIELAFAEARAALDVALEVLPLDAQASAVAVCVDQYIRTTYDVLMAGDREAIEDLMGLRDRIEWARMAARARGRLAGVIPLQNFRAVELIATDTLLVLGYRNTGDLAPTNAWPSTFIWRLNRRDLAFE